jgi:hypothetical protein
MAEDAVVLKLRNAAAASVPAMNADFSELAVAGMTTSEPITQHLIRLCDRSE